MVVVFWVLDPPDVHLDGYKLILSGQQAVQESVPHGFANCVPKLAL